MQKIKKILENPITYKLLIDVFVLTLIAMIIFITGETIIPGIISAYVSPITAFAIIFVLISIIAFITHKTHVSTKPTSQKKSLFILSIIFFIALISIASFRFDFFFGSIVVIFSIAILFLFNSLLRDIIHN